MTFTDPQRNIEQFKLGEGMRVADLGSGPGFYVLAAARKVGGEGKVYAVDVQKDLLAKVKDGARSENLNNIEIIWGDLEKPGGTTLGNDSMDAVILSNVLFQIENKKTFLSEAIRILKPGGKMLFVDWSDSFGGLGPAEEHVIVETEARRLIEEAGFEFAEGIFAGDHHYGMVWKKPRG